MKRVLKRIVVIICVIIGICVGLFGYYKLCMDPYRGTVDEVVDSESLDKILSEEEAKEDLDFFMKQLQGRHPAWLDGSEELVEAVESQYEEEIGAIEGDISVNELNQMASRIAAKLHDGHTRVAWANQEEARYINDFTQTWEYGVPISIDGISIEELLEVYKETSSYELDDYIEKQFYGNVIAYEPSLRLCGIDTSDGVIMTFEKDGETTEYSYDFVPLEEVIGYESVEEEVPWVSYQIDSENSVGIFTLKSCIHNEEYEKVLGDFFGEVFANDIQNVVVDLRGNGGGSSQVANEFITYLNVDEYDSWDNAVRFGWYLWKNEDIKHTNQKKEQVFNGEIFVLTDVWSYSSAMDFAMLIMDNDIGTVVGEPSGNLPDSYGDILTFQMPNSKLIMTVSHKRWYRIDQTKTGEPIMPDYETSSTEALDKVYELIQ